MRSRALLVTLVSVVMLLTTAVAASAGKPVKPPKPTTTTQAPPDFWTCQARYDNGATGWTLGSWDGSAYISGLPSCIDIVPEHFDVTDWTVVWNGTTEKGTVKDLKLVFEEQVHDNVFAEQVFSEPSGFWCPSLVTETNIENMVFVAMPHSADKWLSFEVTVTPGHQGACSV